MPRLEGDAGRSGGDPVDGRGPSARIAPVVDRREGGFLQGAVLPHAGQHRQAASVIFEMVLADSARAERGGQVVLDIPLRLNPASVSGLVISRASRPNRAAPAHSATRVRGEGPGPASGAPRVSKGPVLASPRSWAWSPSWRCRAPGPLARPLTAQMLAQARWPDPSPEPPLVQGRKQTISPSHRHPPGTGPAPTTHPEPQPNAAAQPHPTHQHEPYRHH